jgi:hypothetical protein
MAADAVRATSKPHLSIKVLIGLAATAVAVLAVVVAHTVWRFRY